MKANKFFLGLALIGAILTGCENNVPENNDDEAKAYMSVRISMASSAGTRATVGDPDEFEAGEDFEQKIDITKSIFLFYDENGDWVTSGQLMANTILGDGKECDITALDEAYIVLSGPDAELKKSTQVLTIVNYSGIESLKNLKLEDALLKWTKTTSDPANAGFLMSTSVYVDAAGKIVNTTAITGANIQQDPDDAKDNPVVIHIERASAKAQLSTSTDTNFGKLTVADNKGIVVDGVLSDITVGIKFWTLNNVLDSTFLVKKLQAAWAADATKPFAAWNWAEGHRSYWAEGFNWGAGNNEGNTVYSYNEAKTKSGESMYCYENTVLTPKCAKGEKTPNVNTVLIAAQFEVGNEGYQNLYEYAGVFYREATYKGLIAQKIKELGYTKSGGTPIAEADLVIKTVKDSLARIYFTLDPLQTYSDNITTIETAVNNLAYVKEALGYAEGKCFYQIPVEHLGTSGSAQYGMVRNHVYKIKINSINHVGEPVYNPEIEIPEIPAQTIEHYLAAEVHVLDWHVVEQSVDL